MAATATPLPALRSELVVRPVEDEGQCVVKDPGTGEYFQLGPQEHFLLIQLDGCRDAEAIQSAFEERFGQQLSEDELNEFVEAIREQGLLREPGLHKAAESGKRCGDTKDGSKRPSILYWRKSVFDPDRLFNWMEPGLWFFWTRGFLIFSAGCIVLAALVLWINREQVACNFLESLRWETAVWAWLTLCVVTLLHEFAHGLTCKHYGGEVHEVGFLCMFFMPCFYCNVSDAWLFKEKSKRLWVAFAGGYFELFLWALAVFAWRLTVPGTFPNYLSFIVVTACGVQTLFNFNPLLKLDGYYLLSDWKGIANLQQRSDDYMKGILRRLLWGAARPERESGGRFLLAFGVTSLLFSFSFLAASLEMIGQFAWTSLGWAGVAVVGVVGFLSLRGLLKGLVAGEFVQMILMRRKRTAVWLIVLIGGSAALSLIEIRDRASGPFETRAANRTEVRAPLAGFIREVHCDEGDRVSPGVAMLRLEVPDLASRLAQKRADIRQSESRRRLLEDEVTEQRRCVERTERWRDIAQSDLEQARRVLKEELARLDKQVAQAQAETDAARSAFARARAAAARGAVSEEQASEAERRQRIAEAQLAQAQAERRAREAKGVTEAKLELDSREHQLTETRAKLTFLESSTRTREVDAEQARLDGLREEERYLKELQDKLIVYCPATGVVTTQRLKEKLGQFVREGELICMVENPDSLEAEITLSEQDVGRVHIGQQIGLKARSLLGETFTARVDRIAPAAAKGDGRNTVTVYCRLQDAAALRPGMTGHARVYGDERSIGGFLIDRAVRFLRTEFWW
jgi:multidrug efflux pump subunit AcrA (membrane-fusion protein)